MVRARLDQPERDSEHALEVGDRDVLGGGVDLGHAVADVHAGDPGGVEDVGVGAAAGFDVGDRVAAPRPAPRDQPHRLVRARRAGSPRTPRRSASRARTRPGWPRRWRRRASPAPARAAGRDRGCGPRPRPCTPAARCCRRPRPGSGRRWPSWRRRSGRAACRRWRGPPPRSRSAPARARSPSAPRGRGSAARATSASAPPGRRSRSARRGRSSSPSRARRRARSNALAPCRPTSSIGVSTSSTPGVRRPAAAGRSPRSSPRPRPCCRRRGSCRGGSR